MPEELARTKVIRLRNTRINNLKIEIRKPKPLVSKKMTQKMSNLIKSNPKTLGN